MQGGTGRHGAAAGTIRVRGVTLARLGYRRGQAVLLTLLAVLLVAAAVTGPLYERAVEQAAVTTVLHGSDGGIRGIELVLDQAGDEDSVTLSTAARPLFDAPVAGTDVPGQFVVAGRPKLSTTLTYRDRECTELVIASGRCPSGPNEVLASASTASALGFSIGTVVKVGIPDLASSQPVIEKVEVVGLYRPFPSATPYWFGHPYSSPTGLTESDTGLAADAFFGTKSDIDGLAANLESSLPGNPPRRTVDIALRPDAVTVDDLPTIRSTIAGLGSPDRTPRLSVVTGLSDDLAAIGAQRDQARTIVLVLAVQLAALAAIALGVVAAAAADQRRPELALLRLRGLGRGRTALSLTRELGLLVVAAVVPGAALAWLLTFVASVSWLGGGHAEPELRWPVLLAVVAAVVVGVVLVLGVSWRTVRAPISSLLRQVPATARRGLGFVEIAVAVLAVAGLVTVLTGGASAGTDSDGNGGSPLALLTPTCVAVVLGLIASRLVELPASRSGRRQLARGSVARGLALLAIARRSGARLTVVILAVATGLVVFAGQQSSSAAAARAERAAAVNGAPVVLQVSSRDAPTLVAAVHAADPGGRYATPVVVVRPPGVGSETVVAVDPASFGAVASWGRDDLRPSARTLAALEPETSVPTVTVTTDALTLDLAAVSWSGPSEPDPDADPDVVPPTPSPSLVVTLQHADGRVTTATFGPLPAKSAAAGVRLRSAVTCTDGCRLAGIGFERPVLDSAPLHLDLQIASLTTSRGDAVPLGPGSAWKSVTPDAVVPGLGEAQAMTVASGATPSGLAITAIDAGGQAAAQHLDLPVAAPVLAAGAPPTATDAAGAVTAATLAGGTSPVQAVGAVPFVPQIGSPALLVDLDLAARISPTFDVTAQPAVWLAADDPRRESTLVAALHDRGVDVETRSTTAELRKAYARTAPGWSNQLALIVGVLAELLAVLLVVLVVLTGRRDRQRDLAGLRLVGIDRRTLQRSSLWELGLLVTVGLLGGVVAGLIGVGLSLPSVPVFVTAPPVPLSVVHPLQWLWLIGTIALGVVLLVPTVVTLARRLVAGAVPSRVSGDER